jgi:hypothetical protein
MTRTALLSLIALVSACSLEDPGPRGFRCTSTQDCGNGMACISGVCGLQQQPAGTVALSFSIDDTAGRTYTTAGISSDPNAGTLQWKGSFTYDYSTRRLTYAPDWGLGNGPYPPLYDDGPWNVGGHEPLGATAGDHTWGVTAYMTIPTVDTRVQYGAQDENGWIWSATNGELLVPANQTLPLTAAGMSIPGPGTIDLKLTIDTSALAPGAPYTPGDLGRVKCSVSNWFPSPTIGLGAVYSMTLSNVVGPGTTYPHTGLLHSGDRVEFIFTFGPDSSAVEYRSAAGVTAQTKPPGGAWTAVTVTTAANTNLVLTVP